VWGKHLAERLEGVTFVDTIRRLHSWKRKKKHVDKFFTDLDIYPILKIADFGKKQTKS
jgi:hypothetical protein